MYLQISRQSDYDKIRVVFSYVFLVINGFRNISMTGWCYPKWLKKTSETSRLFQGNLKTKTSKPIVLIFQYFASAMCNCTSRINVYGWRKTNQHNSTYLSVHMTHFTRVQIIYFNISICCQTYVKYFWYKSLTFWNYDICSILTKRHIQINSHRMPGNAYRITVTFWRDSHKKGTIRRSFEFSFLMLAWKKLLNEQ